jgi:outer membrane cobalamin receptor
MLAMLAMLAGLGLAAGPARAATDLAELSLDALLEVPIVGASKYEQRQNAVAAAASVITRNEIKTFGWRTLAEALNSLPGVHITYDRQYTYIGSRGFGLPGDFNTRLLVLINGNRLNDATYDSALLGREFPLDIDLIERIEFIPGPGGAVYGRNAIFGVVNVITRAGIDVDGAELAAAYQDPQSLWHGRATWGKVLDNGADVLLSVSGSMPRAKTASTISPAPARMARILPAWPAAWTANATRRPTRASPVAPGHSACSMGIAARTIPPPVTFPIPWHRDSISATAMCWRNSSTKTALPATPCRCWGGCS